MMTSPRAWALMLLSAIALCMGACASPNNAAPTNANEASMPRTVLITRHAEKGDLSADPPLSDQGMRRAEALSMLPETQSVITVITTQFRRTIETAAPVAVRQGLLSRVVNATARPDDLRALADEILESAEYGTVLVVGHSNTVPLIIRELGGPADIVLTEDDYGDLFILTIGQNGTVSLERTRYGD